eukprot:757508-Hanusia_phi.AAC.5
MLRMYFPRHVVQSLRPGNSLMFLKLDCLCLCRQPEHSSLDDCGIKAKSDQTSAVHLPGTNENHGEGKTSTESCVSHATIVGEKE